MEIREFVKDLSVIETNIRGLRITINLPLTQNRNLTLSERQRVIDYLTQIKEIVEKYLLEIKGIE